MRRSGPCVQRTVAEACICQGKGWMRDGRVPWVSLAPYNNLNANGHPSLPPPPDACSPKDALLPSRPVLSPAHDVLCSPAPVLRLVQVVPVTLLGQTMPATQSANPNGHLPTVSAPASASVPRTKHVRGRSPGAGGSHENNNNNADPSSADPRPPPKRARKAINCEPCRNSKLKCDRNRPCSSCVLRGTTALCYQGQDADPAFRGAVDQQRPPLDPGLEFARIRQSLSLLESHVYQQLPGAAAATASRGPPGGHSGHGYAPDALRRASYNASPQGPYERQGSDAGVDVKEKCEVPDIPSTPGMLGEQASDGLYAGPTSAASHLIPVSERDDNHDRPPTPASPTTTARTSADLGDGAGNVSSGSTGVWDTDLINELPPVPIIDGLVQYYFEYCNWIYRHVNEPWLLAAWERYKTWKHGDRIALATVCILIALAARYLPPRHALLQGMSETPEELGSKCYAIMRTALHRYRADAESPGRSYSLELIELLLVRCHYLTFAKEDPEETWSVRGELVTIGTAMGLHRDPGSTRFEKGVAERRRWAWWHIILLERWQAFMFGRPLAIASHHFNTQLPSYCDPALDKSGRLYLPNIALFRLAYILGDIMDDAVSFRAVQYASVQDKDKLLTDWYESLPPELDLDEFRIARSLASPITAVRRVGVQSVIIRTAYHHIRFTLHRPYAKVPESLEIAVSAASQLIALVGQTRPDFLSNSALAVPGHMNWGPFHVFSAAMFFSFQLIARPDQPAASLFRENIRKALASLEQSRWMPVADKALTILQALAPLYSDDFLELSREERECTKARVLSLVRTLAFPYQDAPYSRSADSPGYNRYTVRGSGATAATSLPAPVGSGGAGAAASQQAHPSAYHNGLSGSSGGGVHAEPISLHHTGLQSHHGATATQPPVSATRWTSQSQSELPPPSHYSQHAPQQPPPQQQQHSLYAHRGPASQPQSHHSTAQQYSPTTSSLSGSQSFPVARYADTIPQQQQQQQHQAAQAAPAPPPQNAQNPPGHHPHPHQPQHPHQQHQQPHQHQHVPQLAHHPQVFRDGGGGGVGHELAYVHPAEESSMWGASMGFALSEWNQFVDAMRPDGAGFAGAAGVGGVAGAAMVPGPAH
ncbi:hypothetical protein C8Q73DRAFT_506017 [Cubamyces lactineus]|nr:hypothetical protein C8Q73DRAFT_506017 [Cubamyces lactineus]